MGFNISHLSPQFIRAFGQTHAEAGRQQAQRSQQQMDQEAAFRQQELDLQRAKQESFERRDFAQLDNAQEIQRLRNQGALDQIALQEQLQQERQRRNQQISRASEQDLQQKLQSGNYAYTPQQRQEHARVMDSIQRVQRDNTFTPEQKEQVINALKLKALGIRQSPMSVLKKPSKYPKGQDIGEVWYTNTGTPVTRNKDGEVKKLDDGFQFVDAFKNAMETHTSPVLDADGYETGKTKVDKEAAYQDVVDQYKVFMALQKANGDPAKLDQALKEILGKDEDGSSNQGLPPQLMAMLPTLMQQAAIKGQPGENAPLPLPPDMQQQQARPQGPVQGPMQGPPQGNLFRGQPVSQMQQGSMPGRPQSQGQGQGRLRPVVEFETSGSAPQGNLYRGQVERFFTQQQQSTPQQPTPQPQGQVQPSRNPDIPSPPPAAPPSRVPIEGLPTKVDPPKNPKDGEIRHAVINGKVVRVKWDARKKKWLPVQEDSVPRN